MSFWCGTCPLVFQRLEGANRTLSADSLTQRLDEGPEVYDEVLAEAVGANLLDGVYLPVLLEIHPQLVYPGQEGDYFCEEQVDTWGIDPFWGVPETPRTPYYRTPSRVVSADALLFEFVVPLVPPSWNDAQRVASYVDLLAQTSMPTCVALSVLDIRSAGRLGHPGRRVHPLGPHALPARRASHNRGCRTNRTWAADAQPRLDQSLARPEELEQLPALLANAPVRPALTELDLREQNPTD